MVHVMYLNIIMKYLFVKFICEIYMFSIQFMHCEFAVLYDSVSHDESDA